MERRDCLGPPAMQTRSARSRSRSRFRLRNFMVGSDGISRGISETKFVVSYSRGRSYHSAREVETERNRTNPTRNVDIERRWCGWSESNRHSFRNRILNPARLPVPPHPHGAELLRAVRLRVAWRSYTAAAEEFSAVSCIQKSSALPPYRVPPGAPMLHLMSRTRMDRDPTRTILPRHMEVSSRVTEGEDPEQRRELPPPVRLRLPPPTPGGGASIGTGHFLSVDPS